MSLSNYAENALVAHLCGQAAFTMPTGIHIKLHVGDPGEDCTANPAGHTGRVAATFAAPSGGVIANSAPVSFEGLTAAGTISHFSAWTASTGGNPLFYGALTTPRTVAIDDDLVFAAGALTVTAT